MESNLLSISKIFTERLLRIPDYQRGYAWGNKEVYEYWNDLIQLELGKSHYVGVLTLEDVPNEIVSSWHEDHWIINKRGYSPFYIVDGQQRLTTTIILIESIIEKFQEKFPDEQDINFTSLKEIKDKFIYLSKDKGVSRSYLFGYEKDNPSYEYLKTRIFLEQSNNHGPLEETIYTANLLGAKTFFLNKLNELTKEEIENIYQKVTQHFVFNLYSLDKEIDTYVAFETMNNRGKSLSHLELLKNRLIYLTTKLDDELYERAELRHSINECWKSIYHYLGKSKDNPLDDDDFLYSHFTLYFDNSTDTFSYDLMNSGRPARLRLNYKDLLLENIFSQKSLYDNCEKPLSSEFISKYVSSLKESVEYWYDIFNPNEVKLSPEISKWLSKINQIRRWQVAAPLILSFFRKTNKNDVRERFLKALERSLYIEHFLASGFYLLPRDSMMKLAKNLNNDEITPTEVINHLNNEVDSSLKESRVIWIKEFNKNSDFYNWNGIQYTLYEYEMSLLKKYKSDRTKLSWAEFIKTEPFSDYSSVEHIYPQRPRDSYWTERFNQLSSENRKKLKNCIGNLVPLSIRKNASLSNKPFPEKVNKGFKYGCYSENEIASNPEWTPQLIIDRSILLLKFMDQRWKLGISQSNVNSNETYLEFLGLNNIQAEITK